MNNIQQSQMKQTVERIKKTLLSLCLIIVLAWIIVIIVLKQRYGWDIWCGDKHTFNIFTAIAFGSSCIGLFLYYNTSSVRGKVSYILNEVPKQIQGIIDSGHTKYFNPVFDDYKNGRYVKTTDYDIKADANGLPIVNEREVSLRSFNMNIYKNYFPSIYKTLNKVKCKALCWNQAKYINDKRLKVKINDFYDIIREYLAIDVIGQTCIVVRSWNGEHLLLHKNTYKKFYDDVIKPKVLNEDNRILLEAATTDIALVEALRWFVSKSVPNYSIDSAKNIHVYQPVLLELWALYKMGIDPNVIFEIYHRFVFDTSNNLGYWYLERVSFQAFARHLIIKNHIMPILHKTLDYIQKESSLDIESLYEHIAGNDKPFNFSVVMDEIAQSEVWRHITDIKTMVESMNAETLHKTLVTMDLQMKPNSTQGTPEELGKTEALALYETIKIKKIRPYVSDNDSLRKLVVDHNKKVPTLVKFKREALSILNSYFNHVDTTSTRNQINLDALSHLYRSLTNKLRAKAKEYDESRKQEQVIKLKLKQSDTQENKVVLQQQHQGIQEKLQKQEKSLLRLQKLQTSIKDYSNLFSLRGFGNLAKALGRKSDKGPSEKDLNKELKKQLNRTLQAGEEVINADDDKPIDTSSIQLTFGSNVNNLSTMHAYLDHLWKSLSEDEVKVKAKLKVCEEEETKTKILEEDTKKRLEECISKFKTEQDEIAKLRNEHTNILDMATKYVKLQPSSDNINNEYNSLLNAMNNHKEKLDTEITKIKQLADAIKQLKTELVGGNPSRQAIIDTNENKILFSMFSQQLSEFMKYREQSESRIQNAEKALISRGFDQQTVMATTKLAELLAIFQHQQNTFQQLNAEIQLKQNAISELNAQCIELDSSNVALIKKVEVLTPQLQDMEKQLEEQKSIIDLKDAHVSKTTQLLESQIETTEAIRIQLQNKKQENERRQLEHEERIQKMTEEFQRQLTDLNAAKANLDQQLVNANEQNDIELKKMQDKLQLELAEAEANIKNQRDAYAASIASLRSQLVVRIRDAITPEERKQFEQEDFVIEKNTQTQSALFDNQLKAIGSDILNRMKELQLTHGVEKARIQEQYEMQKSEFELIKQNLIAEKNSLEQEKMELIIQNNKLTAEIEAAKSESESFKSQLESLQQSMNLMTADYDQKLIDQKDSYEDKLTDVQKQMSEFADKVKSLEAQKVGYIRKLEQQENEQKSMEQLFNEQKEDLLKKLRALEHEKDMLNNQTATSQQQHLEVMRKVQELERKQTEYESELQQKQSEQEASKLLFEQQQMQLAQSLELIQRTKDEYENKIRQQSLENQDLREKNLQYKKNLKEFQRSKNEQQLLIISLEKEKNKLREEIESHLAEIDANNTTKANNDIMVKALYVQLEEKAKEIESLQTKLASANETIETQNAMIEKLVKENESLKQQNNQSNLVNELKDTVGDLEGQIILLQNEAKEIAAFKEQKKAIEVEMANLKSQVSNLKRVLNESQDQLQSIHTEACDDIGSKMLDELFPITKAYKKGNERIYFDLTSTLLDELNNFMRFLIHGGDFKKVKLSKDINSETYQLYKKFFEQDNLDPLIALIPAKFFIIIQSLISYFEKSKYRDALYNYIEKLQRCIPENEFESRYPKEYPEIYAMDEFINNYTEITRLKSLLLQIFQIGTKDVNINTILRNVHSYGFDYGKSPPELVELPKPKIQASSEASKPTAKLRPTNSAAVKEATVPNKRDSKDNNAHLTKRVSIQVPAPPAEPRSPGIPERQGVRQHMLSKDHQQYITDRQWDANTTDQSDTIYTTTTRKKGDKRQLVVHDLGDDISLEQEV